MDGRDGLQLLPGTKKRLGIKVPGENRFLYVGSAILGAALVTMFALNRYNISLKEQIKELNSQFVALEEKRNKKDEAELRLIKDRVTLTSDLIRNHTYWSQAFVWFSNLLQSEVQVRGISLEKSGKMTFSAVAKNYIIIARQLAVILTDDKIKEVKFGGIKTSTDGGLEFGMELKVDLSKIILKQAKEQ